MSASRRIVRCEVRHQKSGYYLSLDQVRRQETDGALFDGGTNRHDEYRYVIQYIMFGKVLKRGRNAQTSTE